MCPHSDMNDGCFIHVGTEDRPNHFCLEVIYVDYGNRAKVTIDDVRPLHPQFTTTPLLAFPCALKNVRISQY